MVRRSTQPAGLVQAALVTHDLAVAQVVADRIMVLRDGQGPRARGQDLCGLIVFDEEAS